MLMWLCQKLGRVVVAYRHLCEVWRNIDEADINTVFLAADKPLEQKRQN